LLNELKLNNPELESLFIILILSFFPLLPRRLAKFGIGHDACTFDTWIYEGFEESSDLETHD
jgi:hypothetical protein